MSTSDQGLKIGRGGAGIAHWLRLLADNRAALLGLLAGAELVVLSLIYTINQQFECQRIASAAFCHEASMAPTRALLGLCFLLMAVMLRPARVAGLLTMAQGLDRRRGWLIAHGVGVCLMLVPLALLHAAHDQAVFRAIVAFWSIGGLIAAGAGLLYVTGAAGWARLARQVGLQLPIACLFGVLLPDLAGLLQPLWRFSPITDLTFAASHGLIELLSHEAYANPETYVIVVDGFTIRVSSVCSGIEGFALIGAFIGGYLWLSRDTLRLPHALLLLPLGIALSWCLNVVRIAVLMVLGASGSERLAIEGFHSHAGWLMFTALSLTLIAAAEKTPLLHRNRQGARVSHAPALTRDPRAAEILPFVAFMTASLVLSTFTLVPALWYAVKVAAMAIALAVFWPLVAERIARPAFMIPGTGLAERVLAPGIGLAIGAAWIIAAGPADPFPGPDSTNAAVATLGAGAMLAWAVIRVVGTVILVPVVEELFFRGYMLRRLGGLAMLGPVGAVVITSGLFAMLHGQWMLAAVAGLAFGWLTLRSGRIADAVIAHAAANALIAAWAIHTGNWDAI